MGRQDYTFIDPTLRALRSAGRYQVLQLVVMTAGSVGAAYQLLGNIFIGRHVTSYRCAAPDGNISVSLPWSNASVSYGECEITVFRDNSSSDAEHYPCLYGYEYGFWRELSFRTEFDLVCDRKLLGGLAQTFVILGQGVGALLASPISDRFGRKPVIVHSQVIMLGVGIAAGFAPSYPVLTALKFLLGALQQAAVTAGFTLAVELFPAEGRAITYLVLSVLWGVCSASMALFAFLLQGYSWRYLQFALSSTSLLAFVLWWYVDESLRWLVANGRKEATLTVLQRAARVNRVDLTHVIKTLEASANQEAELDSLVHGEQGAKDTTSTAVVTSVPEVDAELEHTLEEKQTQKLTLLDIFRHKRLLLNAVIMWFAWLTCVLAFFALYMMSTSLHGNRFLNYFLTAIMEIPAPIAFYFVMNRFGRKWCIRPLYALAGLGLICSGVLKLYADNTALKILSVVSAMLGMVGAAGVFDAIFFYTPELFPTNMRTQALGVASFAGRLGGMLAPFMTDLAEIAIWAPGALIGSLCFLVVIVMHFLPETKGRELPTTIEDIKMWHQKKGKNGDKHLSSKNGQISL